MWSDCEGRVLSLLKDRRSAIACESDDEESRRKFQGCVAALHDFERLGIIGGLREQRESETGKRYVVGALWKILVDPLHPGFRRDQWRSLVLQRFNRAPTSEFVGPAVDDFAGLLTEQQLDSFCEYLSQKGLLEWEALLSGGGVGRITARGVDAIEHPSTEVNVSPVSIADISAQNVQIGNDNMINAQTISVQLQSLIQAIEQSSVGTPEEKAEAKSRLKAFLEHPLTTAVLPAVVTKLIDLLG